MNLSFDSTNPLVVVASVGGVVLAVQSFIGLCSMIGFGIAKIVQR